MTNWFTLLSLARSRAEEALREMGVLLIVFAPLDLAFSDTQRRLPAAALFFALGVVCFSTAVALEHGRTRNA